MPEPMPDENTAPPIDPFEAELVAYLDGELEPAAARRVEARLAIDSQARARAAALKKTFDLLDYLPKPEPSATFATRTLDKLPALQPAPQQPQSQAAPATSQSQPKPARLGQSRAAIGATTRMPPKADGVQELLPLPDEPQQSSRTIIWIAGILLAVIGFVGAGYLGGSAFRSHHSGSRSITNKDSQEELALSDRRLIENLPLYVIVDDYAFVHDLAKPEFFGDDPNVSFDLALKVPSVQTETLGNGIFEELEKAFKLLSLERQQAIRELDKELYADAPAMRDRMLHVLQGYATWLNHLSEADRKAVLTLATSELRLKQIREIRDRQWFESLPFSQKNKLIGVSDSLKRQLLEEWKVEEIHRREEWADARKHPGDRLDASRTPWPFNTESGKNEVLAFAKIAFRLDDSKDTKGSRLAANELERYNAALNFAQLQGGAGWNIYGRTLYELIKRQEEFLLPPPADAKLRYTDFQELPQPYLKLAQGRFKAELAKFVGEWPEFPLKVHGHLPLSSLKGEFKPPPLGPTKISEFTTPVRTFVESELFKKLTETEQKNLRKEEGKWPEYSRELIRLARHHNLSMPGVMLPGSPDQWDKTYGPNRNK